MYEKRKKFIVDCIYFAIIITIAVFGLRWILNWFTPFLLAFAVAYLLNPVIQSLTKKFKNKRTPAAVLSVMAFYLMALLVILLIGLNMFVNLKELFFELPTFYTQKLEPGIISVFEFIRQTVLDISPSLESAIDGFGDTILINMGNNVSAISMAALTSLSAYATRVPVVFIGTMITIIASFFVAIDLDEIITFLLKQLTKEQQQMVIEVKNYASNALLQYAKSFSIILFITFVELSIGLLLLRVENAIAFAFFIAIFDILPVLGTGGILIPWAIISLFSGNIAFGVGMFILYLIVAIVRSSIEPKVIGSQVGLHPVTTLISIYAGARIFGFIGIFLLPILIVIIKQLNDAGKIKLFK